MTRTQEANIGYGVCSDIAPERPGSCTLTIRALNRCGATREGQIGRAWSIFKRRARRQCGRRTYRFAYKQFRACVRTAACACPADIPTTTTRPTTTTTTIVTSTTTTTSTSTTTTSTSTTAPTTTTTIAGATTTSSTTTTTTTSTTTTTTTSGGGGGAVPLAPDGSRCQQECIERVAATCFSDCRDSCGSATGLSLTKCYRACRNGQCGELRRQCVPNDNTDFDGNNPGVLDAQYFVCCKGPRGGDCDVEDDDDSLACAPTTTTTSTTVTTTSSSSTTTTNRLSTTTTTLVVVF